MNYLIEKPKEENLSVVKQLLKDANLPSEDIEEHWPTFLIAKAEDKIIGAVGLEVHENQGLVRSLVVAGAYRKYGVGKELYQSCINLAKSIGINEIGLLTTTAENFFAKFGFQKVSGDEIPMFIKKTKEFQVYCPSCSTIMIKKL